MNSILRNLVTAEGYVQHALVVYRNPTRKVILGREWVVRVR
jgi:hypothetical protein